MTRDQIVACAERWLGTPYRHQQSKRGVGCDCLGLIRGVWRELVGDEPGAVLPYTPSWAEEHGQETLMQAGDQYLVRIDEAPLRRGDPMRQGDVILIRMMRGGPAKHAAIAVGPAEVIHAYAPHAVHRSHLPIEWRKKIGAAYSFPGLED